MTLEDEWVDKMEEPEREKEKMSYFTRIQTVLKISAIQGPLESEPLRSVF